MWGKNKREGAAKAFPSEIPLENRQSRFRREVIWATILFTVMFLTVAGLGSGFLIKDLGDKEVMTLLHNYSVELAAAMARIPTEQKLKGYKQQTIITNQINAFLVDRRIYDSVEYYDEDGKLVYHKDNLQQGDLLGGGPPTGLMPGQQRVETRNRIPVEVAIPIEPGKWGKAVLSVSEETLARQQMAFRHELATKLVAMISIILLMVGLAFLYVLRVLRMTKRIEAEAQDQKRLSYIGLLSSGLAHEIKNPLNSIQMNLQLLEEEAASGASPAELTSWIAPIKKEVRRLERLLNDFLAFARPLNPSLNPCSVPGLLDSLASLVAGEAGAKQVAVRTEAPDDLPFAETDEGLLRTALLNLVLNGVQSSRAGGEVTLLASEQGSRIVIEVSDDGEGIPEDKREEIFQIFFTTKVGGTGLGLPIARRIVEGLGGTLELVEKEGQGACFRVSVPVAREQK